MFEKTEKELGRVLETGKGMNERWRGGSKPAALHSCLKYCHSHGHGQPLCKDGVSLGMKSLFP